MQQIETIQQNKMMQQNKVIIGAFSLLFTLLTLISLFWIWFGFIVIPREAAIWLSELWKVFSRIYRASCEAQMQRKLCQPEPRFSLRFLQLF